MAALTGQPGMAPDFALFVSPLLLGEVARAQPWIEVDDYNGFLVLVDGVVVGQGLKRLTNNAWQRLDSSLRLSTVPRSAWLESEATLFCENPLAFLVSASAPGKGGSCLASVLLRFSVRYLLVRSTLASHALINYARLYQQVFAPTLLHYAVRANTYWKLSDHLVGTQHHTAQSLDFPQQGYDVLGV